MSVNGKPLHKPLHKSLPVKYCMTCGEPSLRMHLQFSGEEAISGMACDVCGILWTCLQLQRDVEWAVKLDPSTMGLERQV